MVTAFQNSRHKQTYQSVLSSLRQLGYKGDRLQEDYSFGDCFQQDRVQRVALAAAFGYAPPSYDNACAAVIIPNGLAGASLVTQYRALGAPLAFEVNVDSVNVWKVGRDEQTTSIWTRVNPEQVPSFFQSHSEDFSGEAILRAKNVVERNGHRQLDFVDVGLIPAIEEQIRVKLDALFHDVLTKTERAFRKETGEKPDERQLFRLIFRLLAAKVLHDRGVDGFDALSVQDGAASILQEVRKFYGQTEYVLDSLAAQEAALNLLWGGIGFQNLSVDTLAHIYENTLVSKSSRQHLGTHSTPASIARYLVDRLPFEDYPLDERFVVEPCSGHCVLLTSAMKRLRQLLPANMTPSKKHKYLLQMLRGFETDVFALEVGKLSMVLADLPNANGWQLENQDVFASESFTDSLKNARIVICNPPFERFTAEEQKRYHRTRAIEKPAELLLRTLDHLHPDASLGFVLPRQFTDGEGYRIVREKLARRFNELEIVALPDKIFHVSKTESAILIARSPNNRSNSTTVAFSEVYDRDRKSFLESHVGSRGDVRKRSVEEVAASAVLPPLWNLWAALLESNTLGSVAEVHRGVEWVGFSEQRCYSAISKIGFRAGFTKVRRQMEAYRPLRTEYLNFEAGNLMNAVKLPWNRPKAILNAARISRGPWRLAAFADTQGNAFTQRFIGIWPRTETIPVEGLAAVLNGPLANAFVFGRERGRDNHLYTIKAVPLPDFNADQWERLAEMVRAYSGGAAVDAQTTLLQIDAYVLAGYNLPPHQERQLLSMFDGETRPVSDLFNGYDIEAFAVHRALGVDDATPDRITQLQMRRGVLTQKLLDKRLTSDEDRELSDIDVVLDRYSDTVSPLPFDRLEQLEAKARLYGFPVDSN